MKDKKKVDTSYKCFWNSIVSGTAATFGVFNGMHAGNPMFYPTPPISYSLATALLVGGSVYGAKRLHATVTDNNDGLNAKSEARSQALVAGAASGMATFGGWAAIRYIGHKAIIDPNFSMNMMQQSLGKTVAGVGLVGLAAPILLYSAREKFSLFNKSNQNMQPVPISENFANLSSPQKKC